MRSLLAQIKLGLELPRDPLGILASWQAQYGDFYRLQIGEMQQFFIVHPDDIREVLVTQASKFIKDFLYRDPKVGIARYLGNGLLTSDGEFWKRQRRLVAPAFHPKRIESYATTMVDYTTRMLAGHETIANTLNWTWMLLAQHRDVEARLHAELDAVLGGRPPSLEDLPNLPYTEMVVKEAMRLYPAAWAISREAIEDVPLRNGTLPRGSVAGVMIYFTHRDPRWWPDPERFDSERFRAENAAAIPRYAYLPFGGGPRVCIGNGFAMMEARLLLATIASRYRLELAPGHAVKPAPLITLNPKGGMPMIVRSRSAA